MTLEASEDDLGLSLLLLCFDEDDDEDGFDEDDDGFDEDDDEDGLGFEEELELL